MKRGALWPVAMVGVLAVTVIANAVLLWAARDRNAAVVEPDYYRKAVAWDSTLAQERQNLALGWRLDAGLVAASAGGALVRVKLVDRAGRPVRGAMVAVMAIHNADAARTLSAVLAPEADGSYAAPLPLHHRGLWELRFVAHRGAEAFTATLRRESTGSPRVANPRRDLGREGP